MRESFTPPASNFPLIVPGVGVGLGGMVDVGADVLVGGLVAVGGIDVAVGGIGVAAGAQATNIAINAGINNQVNFDKRYMGLLS